MKTKGVEVVYRTRQVNTYKIYPKVCLPARNLSPHCSESLIDGSHAKHEKLDPQLGCCKNQSNGSLQVATSIPLEYPFALCEVGS